LVFAAPPVNGLAWRFAETIHAGHGRIAQRVLIASTERHDCLARTWPGVGQVVRLRRHFPHAFTCTQQIISGFTRVTNDEASPERLRERIRQH
jgi:hypothetical protein